MEQLAHIVGYSIIYFIGICMVLAIACGILEAIIGFFSEKKSIKTDIRRLEDEIFYLKQDIGYDKIRVKIEKEKGKSNEST